MPYSSIEKYMSVICKSNTGGRLALCFAPGKHDRQITRDLCQDLQDLKDMGYDVIANLLDSYELQKYRLPPVPRPLPKGADPTKSAREQFGATTYPGVAATIGIDVMSYPGGIVEMMAPSNLDVAHAFLQALVEHYEAGRGIVMHCRAGVGRAGMMGATFLLLTKQAATAEEAIAMVRLRRCAQAIESRQQERFVLQYEKHLQGHETPT